MASTPYKLDIQKFREELQKLRQPPFLNNSVQDTNQEDIEMSLKPKTNQQNDLSGSSRGETNQADIEMLPNSMENSELFDQDDDAINTSQNSEKFKRDFQKMNAILKLKTLSSLITCNILRQTSNKSIPPRNY